MTISLTHATGAPSWTTLQALVCESLNVTGRFTRIARLDGQANYRARGVYAVTFTPDAGNALDITIHVS